MSCILPHMGGGGGPNWYWLKVGQGLLSLLQVRIKGECSYFFCFVTFFHFPFSPLSLSFICSTISPIFSLSLGDHTKWPTMVDVSLNPNQESGYLLKSGTVSVGQVAKRRIGFSRSTKDPFQLLLLLFEQDCLSLFPVHITSQTHFHMDEGLFEMLNPSHAE